MRKKIKKKREKSVKEEAVLVSDKKNEEDENIDHKERDREIKKNVLKFFIAFGLLVIIIVGGSLLYKYYQSEKLKKYEYNGFKFYKTEDGFWTTLIESKGQLYTIPFYYHPKELEDIQIEKNIEDKILKNYVKEIYISFDPDAGSVPVIGGVEISRITGFRYNLFNIPTRSALSREDDKGVETIIKNCSDAGNGTIVILFQKADYNKIYLDKDCIILNYNETNSSIKVADRFVYTLLKIM